MYLKLIYGKVDSQGLEQLNETNVQFIKTQHMAREMFHFLGVKQWKKLEKDITFHGAKLFCVLFYFVCLTLFLLRLNPSMDK